MYRISCFADEIHEDFNRQLDVMEQLQVRWLSLRTVFGKNVLKLTDEEVEQVRRILEQRGVGVSSIGSPIGKSPIADESGAWLDQTERAIEIAHRLSCSRIRVFSFYMEQDQLDRYRTETVRRLSLMAELADRGDITLVLENEAGIYGQSSARCADLLEAVGSPRLRAAFDPSNFVAAGERPFEESLPRLRGYVAYFHMKDSRRSDGVIVPVGQGDGQVPQLLRTFGGEDLFLTLEPHLAAAWRDRGYTGAELFVKAHHALTGLLEEAGLAYC